MNDRQFYTAVGSSEFSERYYTLCRRFPARAIPPCTFGKGTMAELLSQLGRTTQCDARDNSYNYSRGVKRGTLHVGFVVQKQAVLEFWFWIELPDRRLGSNYAVIAYESAKLMGRLLPQPPYPRPEFHSLDELRCILTECFDLADQLTSVVETD